MTDRELPEAAAKAARSAEPVYQVRNSFRSDPPGVWRDVEVFAYAVAPEEDRRVLYAAPPPPAGWHPIETIPKDGTAVVLCWARDAEGNPIRWDLEPNTAGVYVQVASWWGEEGWVVYCSLPQEPALHFDPTHWMPLPLPPPPASS